MKEVHFLIKENFLYVVLISDFTHIILSFLTRKYWKKNFFYENEASFMKKQK